MRVEVSRVGEVKKRNLTDDEFMNIYDAVSQKGRLTGASVSVSFSSVGK
jgi:hypothetical protein